MAKVSHVRICLGLLLLLLVATTSFSQTPGRPSLHGTVSDPSGARIPGATVVLHGPQGDQTTTTDPSGQYSFTAISNGKYQIQISAPDFKMENRNDVEIAGGSVLDVQLQLDVTTQSI